MSVSLDDISRSSLHVSKVEIWFLPEAILAQGICETLLGFFAGALITRMQQRRAPLRSIQLGSSKREHFGSSEPAPRKKMQKLGKDFPDAVIRCDSVREFLTGEPMVGLARLGFGRHSKTARITPVVPWLAIISA